MLMFLSSIKSNNKLKKQFFKEIYSIQTRKISLIFNVKFYKTYSRSAFSVNMLYEDTRNGKASSNLLEIF